MLKPTLPFLGLCLCSSLAQASATLDCTEPNPSSDSATLFRMSGSRAGTDLAPLEIYYRGQTTRFEKTGAPKKDGTVYYDFVKGGEGKKGMALIVRHNKKSVLYLKTRAPEAGVYLGQLTWWKQNKIIRIDVHCRQGG